MLGQRDRIERRGDIRRNGLQRGELVRCQAAVALWAIDCKTADSLEVLTTAAIPFLRIGPSGYRRLRDGAQVGLEWGP